MTTNYRMYISPAATQYQKDHMLHSAPRVFHPIPDEIVTYCLLTQEDYIIAFNNQKGLPFYTAFVLQREVF